VAAPAEVIPCDLAIVEIGIELNTEAAASARLEVDARQGNVVDERLKTNVARVFGAADVVVYPDLVAGVCTWNPGIMPASQARRRAPTWLAATRRRVPGSDRRCPRPYPPAEIDHD